MASSKQLRRVLSSAADEWVDNQPPWPEWSDAVLAATQWGAPGRLRTAAEEPGEPFEDPAGAPALPDDLAAVGWARPADLGGSWALRPGAAGDLAAANHHLMTSRMIRLIASAVLCLEREAHLRPFPIEHQSDRFRAPPPGVWRPWHHVYGPPPDKDGVQVNPHGKYLVRLFYLGKWRRILVDDRLPVDDRGRLLLPVSEPLNLWLPLLAKALLRVAALSWSERNPSVDFSAVHCLTGWIPVTFSARACSEQHLWCVCCQLLGSTEAVAAAPGCCSPSACPPDPDLRSDLPAVGSRAVFAVVLNPLEHRSRRAGGDGTLSATHFENVLLVSDARYDGVLPSPLWKEYRWKRWAFEKGVTPTIESKPVRSLRVFNPLAASLLQTTDSDDWIDFSIFVKFVRSFEVFYKPSYFKYSLNAWTVSDLVQKPHCAEDVVRRQKGSKEKADKRARSSKGSRSSKSKSPSPVKKEPSAAKSRKSSKGGKSRKKSLQRKESHLSVDEWTAKLDQKPFFFYLLIDSMLCKQLYVCLSAYDTSPPTYAQIFVGKFIWHSSSVAPIAFMLSTFGTKGFALTLDPGLHVFRIWHHMPRNFCLQIFSNTPFSTGSKIKIHQILTADSLSFQHYGSAISQRFCALLDTVSGGEAHGQSYDRLMEALHPPQLTDLLVWPEYHKAHKQLEQAFEESLTEMLAETVKSPEEFMHVIQACQILFLNPKFGEPTLKIINREYYDFIQDRRLSLRQKEILGEIQRRDAAIAEASAKKEKSPKSKKGKLPKSSRKSSPKSPRSSKSDKKAKKIAEKGKGASIKNSAMRSLIKCKEKSLLLSDPNSAILLIKRMMSKVPQLRKHYPFGGEDDYRLHYKDYSGEVSVTDNWIVLIRVVLNLHAEKEVPCALHIWSPTKKLVLRLINNDTHQDVPFGFVENCVAFLSRNRGGYTLCVYGWSTEPAEPWRLRVMGVSRESMLHVCGETCSPDRMLPLPEQKQRSVHGFYVPNKTNLIARCLLEVLADVTALFRLHLSSPSVLCRLAVTNPDGTVVLDTTGLGHIVVPILHLEGPKQSLEASKASLGGPDSVPASGRLESRSYLIEVQVLKESWPLTEEEIKAMLYYKENLPEIYYRNHTERAPESRKSSKETIRSTKEDESADEWFEHAKKPTWSVSVVTDLDKGDSVELKYDLLAFEALDGLRQEWDQEGVDLSRCAGLREEFLDEFIEKDGKLNEDDVFHLTAKKTAQFIEKYGREEKAVCKKSSSETSSSHTPSIGSSRSSNAPTITSCHSLRTQSLRTPSKSMPSRSLTRKSTVASENKTSESARKSKEVDTKSSETAGKSQEAKSLSSQSEERSQENKDKLNHLDMLVRQAGIHKALEERRVRNMEKLKEAYEDTLALRVQVLNNIRIAKAGSENLKKANKKSKSSTKSPQRKKSPKSSKTKKPKKN